MRGLHLSLAEYLYCQFTRTQRDRHRLQVCTSQLHKGLQSSRGHTQGLWSHAAVSRVPNSHKTNTDLRGINAQSHMQQSDAAWGLQASKMHGDHL